MVRNTVGKFIWFGELFYKLFCPVKNEGEATKGLIEEVKKPVKEDEYKPSSHGSPSWILVRIIHCEPLYCQRSFK